MQNITRQDGYMNVLTGLGVEGRDKRLGSVPMPQNFSQQEIDDCYRVDDIAQKIVDKIPDEFYRAGYEILVDGNDEAAKKIRKYGDRLNIDTLFVRACKQARLYGGAAVVLGVDDGLPDDQPVNFNNVRTIRWAATLDRYQLIPRMIQADLREPGYGLPLIYEIQSRHSTNSGFLIHASRVIRFEGVELPEQAFIKNNYWGDSILVSTFNHLRNFNSAYDSVAHLLLDFNQTVVKIENLSEILASGDDELVKKRLRLIDTTRSVVRAIVLQTGEEFQRESTNLAGVPETVKLLANRLVAATGLPHTIILGEGSQGNTSGRSEEIDLYNLVAQKQVTYLKPRQLQFLELVCAAKDGPRVDFEKVEIGYNTLWEMDAQEEATIYKTKAEGDQIYITNGVIDPEEVARNRFSDNDSEMSIEKDLREVLAEPVPIAPVPEADVSLQQTALNGAQVTSLLDVVARVTSGELPKDSAFHIIRAAFPAISEETVKKIMAPIEQGEKQEPPPPGFQSGFGMSLTGGVDETP